MKRHELTESQWALLKEHLPPERKRGAGRPAKDNRMMLNGIIFWLLAEEDFYKSRVIWDLKEFKEMSDVIIVNRYHEEISDVLDKVYTRDLYFRD